MIVLNRESKFIHLGYKVHVLVWMWFEPVARLRSSLWKGISNSTELSEAIGGLCRFYYILWLLRLGIHGSVLGQIIMRIIAYEGYCRIRSSRSIRTNGYDSIASICTAVTYVCFVKYDIVNNYRVSRHAGSLARNETEGNSHKMKQRGIPANRYACWDS